MADETTTLALIRTKLQRPRLRENLVARPRLLEQLRTGLNRKLTLVSALAGAGKSTLLCQWLEDCPCPSAWLSLDEGDNDLAVFLSYFIGAIHTVSPGACGKTLGLLETHPLPQVESIITSLINEMEEIPLPTQGEPSGEEGLPPESLVVVLDDYHSITEPAVHRALSLLIEHLPLGIHLMLASRSDPLLPLPLLRARGELKELRAVDLRFAPEEVEAFLAARLGLDLARETLSIVEDMTEGWITGLQLAALSMRALPDDDALMRAFSKGRSYLVAEYLVSEVLDQQPEVVKEFLLQTSILDRFCAPLCEAVAGCQPGPSILAAGEAGSEGEPGIEARPFDGQAYLKVLERDNLFIIPLDPERNWYRYHHLFQSMLQQELAAKRNEREVASLHTRAGAWLANHGYIEEALQHALAAGDVSGAARLIEANVHEALNQDRYHTLKRWLQMLPDELVQQRPGLLLAEAWAVQHQLNLDVLLPLVQKAEALLDSGVPQLEPPAIDALRGEIDFFWGLLAYWQGDAQKSLIHCQRALERLPKARLLARAQVAVYQAFAYQMVGQKDMAAEVTNQSLYRDRMSSDLQTTRLPGALTLVHILSGDLFEAAQTADVALKTAVQGNLANSIGWGHYLSGLLSYEWNDLLGAAQHFSGSLDLQYAFHPRATVDCYSGFALVMQAQGQGEKARAVADDLLDYALESGNPTFVAVARAFQARLMLRQGDLESALRWVLATSHEAEVEPAWVWLENTILTRARVLIAHGATGSSLPGGRDPLPVARDILSEQLQTARNTHNTLQMIRTLALLALANDASGHKEGALDAVLEAVSLARHGGFVRTFVDLGQAMASLFHQLAGQGIEPEYVSRIVAAFQYLQIAGARLGKLVEPLTNRQLEILALLARQMTNKEIARDLFISPATVKTHTLSIYRKLDVPNRQQAVIKARALSILPPA
jgi:LuxR family maltose regulon positive regulatory protein